MKNNFFFNISMEDEIEDTAVIEAQEEIIDEITSRNLCNEYTKYFQYNVPLPRFTPISPYIKTANSPEYTQYDLDMRRKAEILQYRSLATQENGTTKTQKLTFLFNKTTSLKHIVNRSLPCENTISSSAACDVPGPVFSMYLDKKVPLYNYIKTYSFGDFYDNVDILNWSSDLKPDIFFSNKKRETCFSIIYNSTKKGRTLYTFHTPISLLISGNKLAHLSPISTPVSRITAQIVSVTMTVIYGNQPIKYLQTPTVRLPSSPNLTITLNSGITSFEAIKYIGAISVSNLLLLTQYQYVYDICFTFTMKTTLYDSGGGVINGQGDITVSTNVVSNLMGTVDPYYLRQTGCIITNPALPTSVPFNITSSPPNTVYNL
jgi:hypothetical protein